MIICRLFVVFHTAKKIKKYFSSKLFLIFPAFYTEKIFAYKQFAVKQCFTRFASVAVIPACIAVRGQRVMLDFDSAELYQVETRTLKQAVRRNIERFPSDFMFEITESEYNYLKNSMTSQIVISNERGGRRYMPFAFTEQGVAMLSSVLRSETAIQVNIAIMRAFVAMRSRY